MSEANDIWSNGKGKLPEDKLMAYLEGRLSPTEQHEVEQWLAGEGMESDALEGLQNLPAGDTRQMVGRLNYGLRTQLKNKAHRHRAFGDNKWAWLAIAIVLLLCVLGFIIVKMMM